jgi:hypothetical protein
MGTTVVEQFHGEQGDVPNGANVFNRDRVLGIATMMFTGGESPGE